MFSFLFHFRCRFLFLFSLLRRGPREVVGSVFSVEALSGAEGIQGAEETGKEEVEGDCCSGGGEEQEPPGSQEPPEGCCGN